MTAPRNVFVLCTGRCGSTTFAKASAHATNFTAAHESRSHMTGPRRFAYAQGHIEVDNRLAWNLGRLDRAYGDTAHYVHLLRDPQAVADSFVGRQNYGLIKAWRETMLLNLVLRAPKTDIALIAADMIDQPFPARQDQCHDHPYGNHRRGFPRLLALDRGDRGS